MELRPGYGYEGQPVSRLTRHQLHSFHINECSFNVAVISCAYASAPINLWTCYGPIVVAPYKRKNVVYGGQEEVAFCRTNNTNVAPDIGGGSAAPPTSKDDSCYRNLWTAAQRANREPGFDPFRYLRGVDPQFAKPVPVKR